MFQHNRKTFGRKFSGMKVRLLCVLLYGIFVLTKLYIYRLKKHASLSLSGEIMPNRNLDTEHIFEGENEISDKYDLHRHLLSIRIIRPPPSVNCTPLAVENFPRDLFTQQQRKRGAVILHFICAIYMFVALAILCDEYFIPCLERICEVLKLQPDVAGATFMAAGSSAPELATTLVGVFIAKDDIGLGAVVGSADFNIMLVISVTALFARQVLYLNWWPLVRDSVFYLISIVLLALIIADETVYWYEALILLVCYAVYVVFMYFNPTCDAFWHNWCRSHPTFCPRAIHTEEEIRESLQQHSGAFGHAVPASPVCTTQPEAEVKRETMYDRLENVEDADVDEPNGLKPVRLTGLDGESSADLKLDTEIRDVESWFDTCFSRLRLPRRVGLRARCYYTYSLIVWPIRLLMCLSIPDVRRVRWKHCVGSHWIAFVMSCFWIGVFTTIMMWMITVIGVTMSIPDTIMGLTFIAAGSSVPDAIASVLVVLEGEGDMAVSNAIGSNVFDILICMGLPWFLKTIISQEPIIVYSKGLLYSTLTLFTTVLFLLGVTHLNRWRLTKPYGITLLIGYIVVLLFCSLYELNVFGKVHLPECPLIERR